MAKRHEKAKHYTAKYKHMLAPCKYCRNTDICISSDRDMFPPRDVWTVNCKTEKCNCTGTYTSVREAVRRWNEMNAPQSQWQPSNL